MREAERPVTHGRAGAPAVRRVRAGEGARVRALRLRAVSDPAASIAFLTTFEQELERDQAFWDERAAGGANGDSAAMFVAESGDDWIGTCTVLVRRAGDLDHTGRRVTADRADVVASTSTRRIAAAERSMRSSTPRRGGAPPGASRRSLSTSTSTTPEPRRCTGAPVSWRRGRPSRARSATNSR